jgi:hypothetical protein
MEAQQGNRQLEATIAILAEEFGLDPGGVRRELDEHDRRIRRSGPTPAEERLRQLAAEFAVDLEEIREEAAQIHARLAARGMVL